MFSVSSFLPYTIFRRLFGDRRAFGLVPDITDKDWKEWQSRYLDFYLATQRGLIGRIVNSAGYRIMESIDLTDKRVLEIGPGVITHNKFWHGKPREYVVVDISQEMLDASVEVLKSENVKTDAVKIEVGDSLLKYLEKDSFDIVLAFNSLEHLNPLKKVVDDYDQVLKSGGLFAGAIPAEGGLAWGLGRFFVSRRWFFKNTSINPDKIICWEHPNFAPQIINELGARYERKKLFFWPLRLPLLDINLVLRFIYKKT